MASPSKGVLSQGDYAYLGQPFIFVESTYTATEKLDLSYLGEPFVVASKAAVTPTLTGIDVAYLGQPFAYLEAKELNTVSLDVAYLGTPFVGVFSPPVAASSVRYVVIS